MPQPHVPEQSAAPAIYTNGASNSDETGEIDPMRAALYARVSTVDKDQNPEMQLRILREHAAARGWTVTGEYVDHASAADLRGRIAWRQVWNDDAPFWDVLVVTRIDRGSAVQSAGAPAG